MTLKEISTKYIISSYGKRHDLYSKEDEGRLLNQKYLCSITRNSSGHYKINGTKKWCKNLNQLIEQVQIYVKSLPYNSEFYNPGFRKGLFEKLVFDSHLNNVFGDDYKSGVITIEDIYGEKSTIKIFSNLSDYEEQNVEIILQTKPVHLKFDNCSYIKTECKRDADEIIKALDGLLHPYFLGSAAISLLKAKKMSAVAKKINRFTIKDLEVIEDDYTKDLIQQLECILKELKGELT